MATASAQLEWVVCPVCEEGRARALFDKQGFTVVGCPNCGLRYVNPRPTADWLAAWYGTQYYQGERANAAGAQHLHFPEMKIATARLRLDLIRPFCATGWLVDVGAGGGFMVEAAQAAGWHAVGLEPSTTAARHAARERQVHMVGGRLEEAPFSSGRFNVVTMLDVLEHVTCPGKCLTQARRLLGPGGILLVETPNMAGWLPRLMGARHPWVRPPEHLTYFTPATLRVLLERAGFCLLRLLTRTSKVLTLDYVLSLTGSTNPVLTAVAQGAVGWWRGLGRAPFKLPLDMLVAVAASNRPEESTR